MLMIVFLIGLSLSVTPAEPPSTQDEVDAALLRSAGLTPAGQAAYLERLLLSEARQSLVRQWIDELGHARFAVREQASYHLGLAGPGAIAQLRPHLVAPSAEKCKRVQSCLRKLEGQVDSAVLEAAVRQMAQTSGQWAGPHLWQLLATCPDPYVEEETAAVVLDLAERHANVRSLLTGPTTNHVQQAVAKLWQAHDHDEAGRLQAYQKAKQLTPQWSWWHLERPRLPLAPSQRAQQFFTGFLDKLRRDDEKQLVSMCHIPFALAGRFAIKNREEMTELLQQTVQELRTKSWACETVAVLRLETYRPTTDEWNLLREVPAEEIRVVRVRVSMAGEAAQEGHFFVRLTPEPRLLGIGEK